MSTIFIAGSVAAAGFCFCLGRFVLGRHSRTQTQRESIGSTGERQHLLMKDFRKKDGNGRIVGNSPLRQAEVPDIEELPTITEGSEEGRVWSRVTSEDQIATSTVDPDSLEVELGASQPEDILNAESPIHDFTDREPSGEAGSTISTLEKDQTVPVNRTITNETFATAHSQAINDLEQGEQEKDQTVPVNRTITNETFASAHSQAINDLEQGEQTLQAENPVEEEKSMTTAFQSPPQYSERISSVEVQETASPNDLPAKRQISLYEASKSQVKQEVHSGTFKLYVDAEAPIPKRRSVHESLKYAFVVEGVLSRKECEEFIRSTEEIGFTKWTDDEARLAFRDCDTIEITHPELAEILWSRLKPMLTPEELDCYIDRESDPERWQRDIEGRWVADGTVKSILFSRYLEGGHFAIHTDGFNVETFDRRSLFSLVLYLNDVLESDGGETIFFSNEGKDKMKKDELGRIVGDPQYIVGRVPARAGTCAVFFHNILHQSEPIRVGSGSRKYIIRSDIMYSRTPPVITDPKDAQAFEMYQKAESLADSDPEESARLFRMAFKKSVVLSRIYGM